MGRSLALVCFVAAAAAAGLSATPAGGQSGSSLDGIWTLNRMLSEFPREMGFNPSWLSTPNDTGQNAGSNLGGRGRRGSGGGGSPVSSSPFSGHIESYEEAQRIQLLTAEARNPPTRLMVVDTSAGFTITNELGQSRTLHPDRQEESIEVQGVPMPVTTKHDANRVVVVYRVAPDREVRYTYSSSANPSQLVVEVQFLEHGAGDKARRVYEPGVRTEPLMAPGAVVSASSSQRPPESFDQRPGAELRGLKGLGIVVEDLSNQAVACGLSRDSIENALAMRLTEGGFTVRKNSDDDTYVYVNVITTNVSNGLCVSRYDAFLYTHATAKLSYRDQPVLVQVSLMHRGGIGSSAPSAHAAAVARALENYIDLFVAEIHNANK